MFKRADSNIQLISKGYKGQKMAYKSLDSA